MRGIHAINARAAVPRETRHDCHRSISRTARDAQDASPCAWGVRVGNAVIAASRKSEPASGTQRDRPDPGVDSIPRKEHIRNKFASRLSFGGRKRSEGRTRSRETMALVRTVSGGAPGGAAPLRHWGARASQRRAAARVKGRRALRHWARRLRRSIPSSSRETEKGEGRARQPKKVKSPGSMALAVRAV